MKTPEEIYFSIRDQYQSTEHYETDIAIKAMLEYAEQYAEGFAEWVGKDGWVFDSEQEYWFQLRFLGPSPNSTTIQLRQQYDEHLKSITK